MEIAYIVNKPAAIKDKLEGIITQFFDSFEPVEDKMYVFEDCITKAIYCECHIRGSKIVSLGTIDNPLDPDNQPEYRANRDIVEDSTAFLQMKDDAVKKRSFSNIVAEYNDTFNKEKPLKIIGGQHRFTAISEAFKKSIDQVHEVKVYFLLNTDQRLDVQLISNTNIVVSPDLLDRMMETVKGPELRKWCQHVGLLNDSEDFADRKQRGGRITVRAARTFIINYYQGKEIKSDTFSKQRTMPSFAKTGGVDDDWETLKKDKPTMWQDKDLIEAGRQFSILISKQNESYTNEKGKVANGDFADKALNYAILAAWAFVTGVLQNNKVRLQRHYNLANQSKCDPLNARVLAKVRHKTDPENYRGLGSRTDAKERGRLAELFYFQAEKGEGITKALAEAAIARYYAKQATLEALEAEKKV